MEQEQQRERQRSPNYPAFGLPTAIARAEAFYKRDGKASVPTIAAVAAWGYGSLNGRSLSVLGALRQYGLLEDTGPKMVKLSQIALTILLAAPKSPERARALQEAAASPKVFADLMEQYKASGYPSADTMRRNLALRSNYSEEAAGRIISAFRETIDLLEEAGISETSRDPADDPDERDAYVFPSTSPEQKPKRKESPMPSSDRESIDLPLPMLAGGQAILRLPRHMTEAEHAMLKTLIGTLLDSMKGALVPPPAEAPRERDD
jgi:hypothetical protein